MQNPVFDRIGLSLIVEISERIREVAPRWQEQHGEPFAYLQRGELANDTPPVVTRAMADAVAAGLTRYPKAGGELWFRQAVLARLGARGLAGGLGPQHVMCTCGAQEGLELIFNLFAGQRVVLFEPVWACVPDNIAAYSNCRLDPVALVEREGSLDIDFAQVEAKLPGAALLYLNSPHNPTGKVFTREELTRLNDLCVKHGVRVVSDEAYEDFLFGGAQHVSMLEFPGDHIFAVFTCSKTFAATGFRIGYFACRDAALVTKLTIGEYAQTGGVATFIQKAMAVAMESPDELYGWLRPVVAAFERRRDLIAKRLRPVLDDQLFVPSGSFYFFLNLNGHVPAAPDGLAQEEFVLRRFLDAGVAVIPGPAFGVSGYRNHVRLSFSGIEEEALGRALERIASQVLV